MQHKIRPGMPDMKLPERDPTLVALAYKRQRLYLFSRREPADAEDASVSRLDFFWVLGFSALIR